MGNGVRFKGVGMRWSESGFNHLLHLRLAWANERFDSLFAWLFRISRGDPGLCHYIWRFPAWPDTNM
jgi:hypothetical protein